MLKKIILVLSLTIVLITGGTYAWYEWSSSNTNVSFNIDGAIVTYSGGPNITGKTLIPVTTLAKGLEDGTAIEKDVSFSAPNDMIMNMYLTINTLGNGLKHNTFVYEVYNGETKVGEGNFESANVGDKIKIVSDQTIGSTTSVYTIYIWIDGSVDNPTNMYNQPFNFTLTADASKEASVVVPKVNRPNLVDGLIPVTYSNNTWVKADSNNTDNSWYNYDEKKWANAVLVDASSRASYNSASVGTEVSESNILAYYVWIPRYKYKVWNINKVIGTDSYGARTNGIDIEFETGTESTGTITCGNYSFTQAAANTLNEVCSGSNGEYYTHPAFTFGDIELEGIWVGKFEISSSSPTASNGGGNSTSYTVRVKPNVVSWRYNRVTSFSTVVQNMNNASNIYGISDSTTDTHLIMNMEWGAVAYLAHSNYGTCSDGSCTEITSNTNSSYQTGGGNYASNVNQSTTGNIYGVYDMRGGSSEIMMANVTRETNSYTYNAGSGGTFTYNNTTAKYLNAYARGTSNNNQTSYNRARLGDCTSEVIVSGGTAWNSDTGTFAYVSSSTYGTHYPWFIRGGTRSDTATTTGIFNFRYDNGNYVNSKSSRAMLVKFS